MLRGGRKIGFHSSRHRNAHLGQCQNSSLDSYWREKVRRTVYPCRRDNSLPSGSYILDMISLTFSFSFFVCSYFLKVSDSFHFTKVKHREIVKSFNQNFKKAFLIVSSASHCRTPENDQTLRSFNL